jgi:hypothetical protein
MGRFPATGRQESAVAQLTHQLADMGRAAGGALCQRLTGQVALMQSDQDKNVDGISRSCGILHKRPPVQ